MFSRVFLPDGRGAEGRSLFSGDDHEPAVLRLVGAGDQSKKQVAALGGDAGVVERVFPIIGHGLVEALRAPFSSAGAVIFANLSTSLPDWKPKCRIVSKEQVWSSRLNVKMPLSLIRSQV